MCEGCKGFRTNVFVYVCHRAKLANVDIFEFYKKNSVYNWFGHLEDDYAPQLEIMTEFMVCAFSSLSIKLFVVQTVII